MAYNAIIIINDMRRITGYIKEGHMFNFIFDMSTIELISFSVFIGASLASILLYINKTVLGSVVRALLRANANDIESAKTVAELGLSKNFLVCSALKKDGALRKLVSEVQDNVISLPDGSSYYKRDSKVDIKSARFFIREDNRIRAELRYSSKGSDIFMLIISILVFSVISFAMTMFIPYIMELFGDVTGV